MANIFQRIFLSQSQVRNIDRQQEIMRLISSSPVHHYAYIVKDGRVVRCFSVSNTGYNLYASRVYDPSRPEENQVSYNLCYRLDDIGTKYASHSDIDTFAQQAYMKMYKVWEKQRVK